MSQIQMCLDKFCDNLCCEGRCLPQVPSCNFAHDESADAARMSCKSGQLENIHAVSVPSPDVVMPGTRKLVWLVAVCGGVRHSHARRIYF